MMKIGMKDLILHWRIFGIQFLFWRTFGIQFLFWRIFGIQFLFWRIFGILPKNKHILNSRSYMVTI